MWRFDDLKAEAFEKLDGFFRSSIGVDSLKRITMLLTVCPSGNASYIVLLAIIKKGVFLNLLILCCFKNSSRPIFLYSSMAFKTDSFEDNASIAVAKTTSSHYRADSEQCAC